MGLTKKDIKEINRLRSLLPKEVCVLTQRSEDGGFFAEITTFEGCFTQAESFSELIEMVNDAIRTYFEIPEKYTSYMPSYLPPIEAVKKLDIFPVQELQETVRFKLPNGSVNGREKTLC